MNCECEHSSHMAGEKPENPKHPYMSDTAKATVSVKTPYGVFHVCADCADTCLRTYK